MSQSQRAQAANLRKFQGKNEQIDWTNISRSISKLVRNFAHFGKVINEVHNRLVKNIEENMKTITTIENDKKPAQKSLLPYANGGWVHSSYAYGYYTTATTSSGQGLWQTLYAQTLHRPGSTCKSIENLQVQSRETDIEADKEIVVPDVVQHFVGFKAWKGIIKEDGYWLTSPTFPVDLWPHDQQYIGKCERNSNPLRMAMPNLFSQAENTHNTPSEHCRCGVYGTYDIEELPTGLTEKCECESSYHFNVFGIIKAMGDIIPARNGFRAQYAQPAAFIVPKMTTPKSDEICLDIGNLLWRYSTPNNILVLEDLAYAYNVPLFHVVLDYGVGTFEKLLSLMTQYVNTDDPEILTQQSEIFIYEGGIDRRELGA